MDAVMADAVRLRTAQDAPRRRIYDALPRYVQSTLSLHDRDGALRGGPLAPRIAQALQWKEQGNELFRAKDAEGAASLYSRAAGLFVFVAPRVPDWRTQGVLDSSVGVVCTLSLAQSDVGPEAHGLPPAHTFSAPEEAPARELLGSLYSNLAAALLAQREWGEAVRAAGDALRCNPRNAKALFRRALARARSPASGSVELEMAVADLEAACALEPTNGEYSRELSARAAELARADRAHRAALHAADGAGRRGGEEDGGEDEGEEGKGKGRRTGEGMLAMFVDRMEVVGQELRKDGKEDAATFVLHHVARAREQDGSVKGAAIKDLVELAKAVVSEGATSPEQVNRVFYENFGLDLSDPATQQLLSALGPTPQPQSQRSAASEFALRRRRAAENGSARKARKAGKEAGKEEDGEGKGEDGKVEPLDDEGAVDAEELEQRPKTWCEAWCPALVPPRARANASMHAAQRKAVQDMPTAMLRSLLSTEKDVDEKTLSDEQVRAYILDKIDKDHAADVSRDNWRFGIWLLIWILAAAFLIFRFYQMGIWHSLLGIEPPGDEGFPLARDPKTAAALAAKRRAEQLAGAMPQPSMPPLHTQEL